MFRNILVPLDGSELAELALPCAERLATATGATLHLTRVVEPIVTSAWGPAGLYLPAAVYDELEAADSKAATEYLAQQRNRLVEAGLRVQAERLDGYPAAALFDYERVAAIDLVVMSSHGRSGLVRFALGSVADRLLRHGTAPVLLVRPFGSPVTLADAVIPLDGSSRAEEALAVVDTLAGTMVREVTLLRVIDTPQHGPEAERYLEEVALRFQQQHLACWCRVVQGDPAAAILEQAGSDKLVVMATHGRSGATRWALGSVSDRVARGGAAGVLIVRAGAASAR